MNDNTCGRVSSKYPLAFLDHPDTLINCRLALVGKAFFVEVTLRAHGWENAPGRAPKQGSGAGTEFV